MNKNICKSIAPLLLAVVCSSQPFAQATQNNIDPDADFKLAKELYQKEQFSLAYPLFKSVYLQPALYSNLPVTSRVEAAFYTIVCGLKLNQSAAEKAAVDFISSGKWAPYNQKLSYHLAEYYYRHQQLSDAMTYYERAGIDNLSNREIADMKFHQAYGYFTQQQFAQAKPLFNAIRQIPEDPNYIDANYYYGFISFYEKNYPQALQSFKIVENQPAYQNIVPYYITEILYFSGDKDAAIAYGEAKLQQGGQYYDLQLRQLVGHAYFEKKNYAKALPYLQQYVSSTEKVRREDLYELSYAYYETNQLNKAIEGFKELGGKDDSLAQNSMYLLADAYLKTNQKANARSAFLFCASNSSNAKQREISVFNYAKLSFELGYADVALAEFKNFLATWPNSEWAPEARDLLVNVLANTNNYREALALYESLPAKSETVKRVYPRMLYGRAVEHINDQQLGEADQLLNKILEAPYNQAQLPLAYFWKGEIAFRNNNPDAAITYLNQYLQQPVTAGEVNPNHARYNMGYAYLQKENYRQALGYFEQVTKVLQAGASAVEQDAYVRSADGYFMNRNYTQAQNMYDKVIAMNLPQADYALYQKALIAGAINRGSEKINLLQSVAQRYPGSQLVPEAQLEIANTYLADESYSEAIAPLNQLLRDNRARSMFPQAYLKLGVAHFNLNNNQDALSNFKTLVSGYPNSAESDDAVEYIRNIFIEQQQPSEFVSFMRQNGKTISYSEEDSLTYASAYIRYNNNDAASALSGFRDYINKFPEGRYTIDASYYAAEIYNSRKDYENAVIGYDYVGAKAPNRFAERSLLQAARLAFFELKDYEQAEDYFTRLKTIATAADTRLESMRGLLRAQYRLNKWTEAVPNAQELLQQKGIATDDKMMAYMVLARSDQQQGNMDRAILNFRTVYNLGKSEYGAEARYQVAEILFGQNKLDEAETAGFDVINKAGSYEYWTTKAYLLLGDIYWKQGDYFNAEATFKSVAENATIEELKTLAQNKLSQVVSEKNKNSKVDPQ